MPLTFAWLVDRDLSVPQRGKALVDVVLNDIEGNTLHLELKREVA
jgi:hypothetical protein